MNPKELNRRIIFSMLKPAIKLSAHFQIPLKEITQWVEIAYFQEIRGNSSTLQEVKGRLRVGMSKVSELSKKLKTNFFQAQKNLALSRRIEFMLWNAPLSKARIQQVLTDVDPEDIEEVLEKLTATGRLKIQKGRVIQYTVVKSESRIVRDNIMARIDGLNNLLDPVCNAVFGRFFNNEPKTFARVLSFRVRKKDFFQLEEIYSKNIWEPLVKLDEAAHGDPDSDAMELAICWAPYDYLTNSKENQNEDT